jgi:hypothetical protein
MVWNQQDNTKRRWFWQILGIFSISLFLATQLGPALMDPSFLVPMSCLSILLVGPLVVQTRKPLVAIPAAVGLVAASIGISLALTGAGIPSGLTIAKAGGYSLVSTSITGGAAWWMLQRLSPVKVIWILRAAMLGLYLLYRFRPELFFVD